MLNKRLRQIPRGLQLSRICPTGTLVLVGVLRYAVVPSVPRPDEVPGGLHARADRGPGPPLEADRPTTPHDVAEGWRRHNRLRRLRWQARRDAAAASFLQ